MEIFISFVVGSVLGVLGGGFLGYKWGAAAERKAREVIQVVKS